jgi:adenosylmethionine-8-amino-7-oxononanoate aminotransferase
MTNSKIQKTRSDDNRHWMHPWEYMATAGGADRTVISHAEGIYLHDDLGARMIDGPAGMWCTQIGYGRKEMADAIAEQVMKLSYVNPFALSAGPPAELAQKLASMAPGSMSHVFFTTGGTTAVETALRFVHYYNNVLGRPQKKQIISRADAYHGSSFLTGMVAGKDRDKSFLDITSSQVHLLSTVNPKRRPAGMTMQDFCDARVRELENKILELGAENVGAFIAEPVQASGGVIVAPDGYYKAVWEVCKKHDVLFIADEVVTAFGRLGHWFASKEVFGVEPDLVTCAKGITSGYLPLGACLISDRVFDRVSRDNARGGSFAHGYTNSGHPVCAVAALKNIEIMEREGLLANVLELAPHFQARLRSLRDIPLVFDTRGIGLLGCVECTVRGVEHSGMSQQELLALDVDLGSRIDRHCQSMGLMLRPIVNQCVFSPALIISRQQIDEMFDIMREGIIRTMHDVETELGYEVA